MPVRHQPHPDRLLHRQTKEGLWNGCIKLRGTKRLVLHLTSHHITMVNKTPPPVPIRSTTRIPSTFSNNITVVVKPLSRSLIAPPPPPPPPARDIKLLINSQGRDAFRCVCPVCRIKIRTRAEVAANTGRVKEIIIWASLAGCIGGVILLPFVAELFSFIVAISVLAGFILMFLLLGVYVKYCSIGVPDVVHYCPECGTQLGINFGCTVSVFGSGTSSGHVTSPSGTRQQSATSLKVAERHYPLVMSPLKRSSSDSTILDIDSRAYAKTKAKFESEV